MHTTPAEAASHDAWNPGLDSSIPPRLLPAITLFRPESSSIDYAQAREIGEFCGLQPAELVFFTVERLAIHDLLVRVTADLSVPDGPNYADLGIALRGMVDTIFKRYVLPRIEDLRAIHAQVGADAKIWLDAELQSLFEPTTAPETDSGSSSLLGRLFGQKTAPAPIAEPPSPLKRIDDWNARLKSSQDPFEASCLRALARVVGAVYGKRGRLVGDRDLLTTVAMRMVCNDYGSQKLGEAIHPIFAEAAEKEGYYVLPPQQKPVIMNVKGASAAGKSTVRTQQRRLAEKLDIPWRDFAVVSPDYWRKYLLDYDSLGDDFKYAAMLTGQELVVIDKKLDRHMTEKARLGRMTHLLIDRFRFDSFVSGTDGAADTKLLTRFGDLVFMFFMITPPAETVERAWQRGIQTGRYKAVDDLLYHNVEAYTGIPELFFSWALSKGKRIHYEFLDNDVPPGEPPRTVAFGWNGAITILDVKTILDIDRFRRINIKATRSEDIFADASASGGDVQGFLERCRDLLPTIQFADYDTGYVYGIMENGKWVWRDDAYVHRSLVSDATREGLRAIGWDTAGVPSGDRAAVDLSGEKAYTLGQWAPELAPELVKRPH